MKTKKLIIFVVILILAFSIVTPVMADDGDVETTETEEKESSEIPILKYFRAFFELKSTLDCDDPDTVDVVEECPPPDCDDPDTVDIVEECPPPEPLDCEGVDADTDACVFGATIGTLHDDGIGFGVLANLMMISIESQECEEPDVSDEDADPECNPVTFEDLMELYANGMSIGEIYETYGKPAHSGVGGLKNAEKLENKCGEDGSGPPGLCGDKEHGKPENPGKSNNNKKP